MTAGPHSRPDPAALQALGEFIQFVGRASAGASQRRRLANAVDSPVTDSELTALRALRRHGALTVGVLAERLHLDQTTVSRLVGRLIELGLADRTPDTADRRRAWTKVTEAGEDLLHRLDLVSEQDYRIALQDWTPADQEQLAALLARLRLDLERLEFDESGRAVGLRPAGAPQTHAPRLSGG